MEEGFNLSDYIDEETNQFKSVIATEIVKEFIKLDWKLFIAFIEGRINLEKLIKERNKIAGEKLK